MLEVKKVKQDTPGLNKRWFNSSEVDIFVWLNSDSVITSFQICYDKLINEYAFIWSEHEGYYHFPVSDGESISGIAAKITPILIEDKGNQIFPKSKLLHFLQKYKSLDQTLFKGLINKVKACPFEQYWYLYIIRTGDNTLYTGITTDIDRRFNEHCTGNIKSAKYLRGKTDLQLVFQYRCDNRASASSYEAKIKKLAKVQKEMLVNGNINIKQLLSI